MIEYYIDLLADPERLAPVERAIREAVRPDDVVVDLGCGVGTFAIFAARAGARRVFGVDNSPAIEYARELAQRNGVDVEFISGDARDVRLPEPATLLIFEDFSSQFFSEDTRGLLESVISNWMAKDKEFRVVPEYVTLNIAPICGHEARKKINPLQDDGSCYGLDITTLLATSCNTVHHANLTNEVELLAPPELVYKHKTDEPLPHRWAKSGVFEITQAGTLEGLCLWHDLLLSATEKYSNRPGMSESRTWGQAFFPLPEPWLAQAGEQLSYDLIYEPGGDGGLWKWNFRLMDAKQTVKNQCTANSFAGLPMSHERLLGFRPDTIVRLTDSAEIEALVLSLVDGKRSFGEIADELQRQKPEISSALETVIKQLEGRSVFDRS